MWLIPYENTENTKQIPRIKSSGTQILSKIMSKTKDIKLMIIENFIDHFTSDESEREKMKETARTYVEEDWVDEIAQSDLKVEKLLLVDDYLADVGLREDEPIRCRLLSVIDDMKQNLQQYSVNDSLPSAKEIKPFLHWVFHKADRIWVEHTLGWRDNAIEEMYEAYKRTLKI